MACHTKPGTGSNVSSQLPNSYTRLPKGIRPKAFCDCPVGPAENILPTYGQIHNVNLVGTHKSLEIVLFASLSTRGYIESRGITRLARRMTLAGLRQAMHREPIITWSLLIGGVGMIINRSNNVTLGCFLFVRRMFWKVTSSRGAS